MQVIFPEHHTLLTPMALALPKCFHWLSLLSLAQFPEMLVSNLAWASITFVGVELCRDAYHVLGHRLKALSDHHLLHHTAYRPGYLKRWQVYYTSYAHYDVPEAIVMVMVATMLCLLGYFWVGAANSLWGCLFIAGQAVLELVMKSLRMLNVGWAIGLDKAHLTGPLDQPPSIWRVNRAYHYRHHYGDPDAYFNAKTTLLDKLLKTALSLKRRTIAFDRPLTELDGPFRQELQRAGATVFPQGDSIDFENTDILVINLATAETIDLQGTLHKLEQFLSMICTNDDITTKEVWVVFSAAESALAFASLNTLYQRYLADWITQKRAYAPCVLRKIVVGGHDCDQIAPPEQVAKQIVTAIQRDFRNVIVRSQPWMNLFQPLKEWMVSTYFRVSQ